MDFTNSAIIQEEILLDIIQVIENGWPAGPKFLHALGTLVEAITIHNRVFFDPLNYFQRDDLHGRDATSIIRGSNFVKELIENRVLFLFPQRTEVDSYFERLGSDYSMTEFLADTNWEPITFASGDPSEEESSYRNLIDLSKVPKIFENEKLIERFGINLIKLKPIALEATSKFGFNIDDLRTIESLNRRAKAFVDLAKNTDTNLYSTLVALPHQFGAVRMANSRVQKICQTIEANVLAVDESIVGKEEYRRVPIPPLTAIVLDKCKDSPNAIAQEICELRDRHKKFRDYLTSYERLWVSANTRGDRIKLDNEFNNAWDTLTKSIERPKTRIHFKLWYIFRNTLGVFTDPLKILDIGDKLSEKGKELSIIGRVRGLPDFRNELANSPIPEKNRELLSRLFPKLAQDEVWKLAREYTQSIDELLG